MQLYESIFVVRPSLSDEDTSKIIEKMKGVLEKSGATLLKLENWGKKKLAYEVKRERKGTFVYFHFKSPGNVVGELERSYRLEDSVIKFLTVRQELDVHPLQEGATGTRQEGATGSRQQGATGTRPAVEAKEPDRDRVQ
jgi:small subunit ribosomal protein S6